MVRSDENNLDAIGVGQTNNIQGGGIQRGKEKMVSEIRHQRRALSDISSNIVGVLPHRLAVVKKEFSGKPEINDKDPNFPVHRPITRKFAEQIAKKQALSPAPKPEESKEPVEPISNPSESENSVDDNKIANKMEEVEMVDIEGEPVIDIDSYDVKNPLAVVEYIEDIYDYYRKAEISSCVSATYMEQQDDINGKMRAILIDWLIEVHYKFELRDETLFLTVNLIDRFLERQTVLRKKLQLVGVTAMFLACKYEEITVPVVRDLVLLSDNAYTRKEVLDMERLMVNTLQFNMSVPTPYVFMRRFLKAAQSDKKLELLTFFIIELSLVEYEMLKYPPSLLAASAIYTAQCTITNSRNWSKTIESHTKYSEDQLLECSRLMVSFHQNAATGKLTGVHRKYSAFRFGDTSKTVPALFLLETSP